MNEPKELEEMVEDESLGKTPLIRHENEKEDEITSLRGVVRRKDSGIELLNEKFKTATTDLKNCQQKLKMKTSLKASDKKIRRLERGFANLQEQLEGEVNSRKKWVHFKAAVKYSTIIENLQSSLAKLVNESKQKQVTIDKLRQEQDEVLKDKENLVNNFSRKIEALKSFQSELKRTIEKFTGRSERAHHIMQSLETYFLQLGKKRRYSEADCENNFTN
ncbi:unnamed protein product [Orchesella dallaii]|uniref:Uncharacterized protein n=1 Tax=Orchesella dallaii TaxID=48710 RepID=A0ABP1RHU0_9HEXA